MSTVSPEQLATPRYCQVCGSPLIERYFEYEARTRLQCEGCGFVHYLNPRVVAAVIIEHDGRVLLQRRAMEPGVGLWTFPGGFLEIGERPEEGAVREAKEEVGLDVELAGLHGVYSRPHVGIVLVVYAGTSASDAAVVGDYESTEVAWFAAGAIPWDELAFDTTRAALEDWVGQRDGR
ncbi:MAG: NUDIX domain-containing protein [Dehalococcoidia bacterium]|nr:MAG: NUDIX domain-containing protein [Dehalococcoidia bacterium]